MSCDAGVVQQASRRRACHPTWSVIVVIALAACSGQPLDSPWVFGPPMPVARSEHAAVSVASDLVVVGGFVEARLGGVAATASVEAFDGEQWRSLPDLPEARHHVAAAVVDDRLFVLGGFDASGFSPVTTIWELTGDRWMERAALPGPVGAGAAVTIEGRIYLVGGVPDGRLYAYDPGDDSWSQLADPIETREHLAAVAFEGELWALGGRWNGDAVATTEIYDPSTDSWRSGPPMSDRRSGFGATVANGSIVVAGGEIFDPLESLSTVERLADGEWEAAAPLPFGLHGNPMVTVDGVLMVPGGSERPAGVENRGALLRLED